MNETQSAAEISRRVEEYSGLFRKLKSEISQVIVGQRDVVDETLLALMAGGHVLIEGVPGLGKTLLVRTLADTLDLRFTRVQFTPDLMPADIIGTNVIIETETGGKVFTFQPGPVFTNLLLADEINRASPKTQSALLEAMQERQVSVGGATHALGSVFFVLATQNPIEMEGTYPLPEAQLDRFIFKILIQYPERSELIEVLKRTTTESIPRAEKVLSPDQLLDMRLLAREVLVAPHLEEMVTDLVLATHPSNAAAPEPVRKYVRFGASPRGAQAILLTAKAKALLDGRYNISESDVAAVFKPSLRHRIILNFEGEAEGVKVDPLLDELMERTARGGERALRA